MPPEDPTPHIDPAAHDASAFRDDGEGPARPGPDGAAPFHIHRPDPQTAAVVFASPHSGRHYPQAFLDTARLDPVTLRRSEDAFVDEIFAGAPARGAPLLSARFPRAYVDPNREAFELDPAMFDTPLPAYVNTTSPRVGAGLGTVARVVASGEEIYGGPLSFVEARRRIEATYTPYHAATKALIRDTKARFGACLLIDCHSMPSIGGPMDRDPGRNRVDMVLGDGHGTTCAPTVTDLAERVLKGMGFVVTRNAPYAGGYTTRHYGRPRTGVHTLQIEINRALYMDEERVARTRGLGILATRMNKLIDRLVALDADTLQPETAA